MDQLLIFASLSHTHYYWYEVGMLKVLRSFTVFRFISFIYSGVLQTVLSSEFYHEQNNIYYMLFKSCCWFTHSAYHPCNWRNYEDTTIVSQSRLRSHHADSSLLKPTGIQIARKPFPGPSNREHRKSANEKPAKSSWKMNIVIPLLSLSAVLSTPSSHYCTCSTPCQ